MGRTNAAACYRQLGVELRKRRERAGLTARQVARRTGWSPTKICRIESGRAELDVVDLVWYLGFCDVYKPQALDLIDLCREAKLDRGYWLSAHGERIPDSLSSLIYHESTAARSTMYEPIMVPGLLQTEAYARAMISREGWRTPADIESSVQIRLARQQVLANRAARFTFFIHEHAVRTEVGGPAVMHEQMIALALTGAMPNITVRLLPAAGHAAALFGGPFRVFEYDEHNPLVYLDAFATGMFLEGRDYVAPYLELGPKLAAIAQGATESREFFAAMADEYDRGSTRHVGDCLEEEQP